MKLLNKTFLCTLLLSVGAHAGDLKAPFSFPTAKVLPAGVRNISFKALLAQATEKFDGQGEMIQLGQPLNGDITFKKVYDSKRSSFEKAGILNIMHRLGKNLDDSFGYSTGEVNVSATARVPVFAYGLNEKMTLAIAIPVMESNMKVKTGVVHENTELHRDMIQSLNDSGLPSKVVELYEKLSRPVAAKLYDYGYDQLENKNNDEVGDIKVISKYNHYKSDNLQVTSTTDITLPTGRDQDINKIVDVASGDDQTDLGIGVAADYKVGEYLTLSSAVAHTVQLADKNPERIPEVSYSKASPDVDSETERDLGNISQFQLAGVFNYKGLNLGAGYSFQYKEQDSYNGTKFSRERYSWLEQDTEQVMHALQLTAGVDTFYFFKKKVFPAPLKLLVSYTNVFAGENVVSDPLVSVDFNLYF